VRSGGNRLHSRRQRVNAKKTNAPRHASASRSDSIVSSAQRAPLLPLPHPYLWPPLLLHLSHVRSSSTPFVPLISHAAASALAALQVRLLDGSLVKFELPPSAPLSEVRAVLTSKHNQRGAFSLLTPFPRRVYALAEEDRTLAELGLTGAVTLIVTLPDTPAASRAQQPATRAQSQSWGGYLWSWLTWSSPASTPAASHTPMPSAPAAHAPPPGRQVRTLHDQPGNDDDEDRKTWNGNSTQQM
jgi:hypothetical protein